MPRVEHVEMVGQTASTVGKALSPRKGLTPERGAAIVLWLGVVLVVISVVGGLLNTFRNSSFSYVPTGVDVGLLDRVQIFVQSSITQVAWSALVLALGIALHIWVRRPAAVMATAPAPTLPEIDESPVALPQPGTGAISITPVPAADDDFWRR
ncbi:MAG: hypothetical protein RL238_102 [Actinomycetota bacterium]|jgi:hypothetical protein